MAIRREEILDPIDQQYLKEAEIFVDSFLKKKFSDKKQTTACITPVEIAIGCGRKGEPSAYFMEKLAEKYRKEGWVAIHDGGGFYAKCIIFA